MITATWSDLTMAQRHVRLDLRNIADFLRTHKGSLAAGAILIPASAIDGGLAPEFRVEIQLPFGLVTPPITCQIIQRMPDGGVAGQIPELPTKAKRAFAAVLDGIQQVRRHLLETGELVEPGQGAPQASAPPPAAALTVESEPSPGAGPAPAPSEEATSPPEESLPKAETESEPEVQPAASAPEEAELDEVARSHPQGLMLPPGFEEAPAAEEGELKGRELRQQVMDLAFTNATGILHIQEADGTERFGFWLRGGPVGWARKPLDPKETLGGLLVRSKHISEEQLERALERQGQTRERLGQILVDEGALPPEQLGPVLSKQVDFVLQLALRAREGTWRFVPTELGQSFPLEPTQVLEVLYKAMASHGRTLSPERIFGVIRPQLNKRVKLLPSAEGLIERVSWTAGERVLLEQLQGASALVRNLFNQVDLPRAEVAVTLWALSELGVISFGKVSESLDKARYLKQITGPIQQRLTKVQESNPFDALDLSWICAQAQVDRAYETWQGRFAPERFEVLSVELRADLSKIQEAHEAAYQAIKSQAQRRALRIELVGEQAVKEAAALLLEKAESVSDEKSAARARAKAADLVS